MQNHIKAIFDLPEIKRENSVAIRNTLDGVLKHKRALQALKRPTSQWDDLLVHIITSKLDFITIKEWENSLNTTQLPKFQEVTDFLTRRCQTSEAVARRDQSTYVTNISRKAGLLKTTASHAAITNTKCINCKRNHQIYQCKNFLSLSVNERSNRIKSMGLCLNCLKGKHLAKECQGSFCKLCEKKHSTLLHDDRNVFKKYKSEQETQATVRNDETNKLNSTVCNHARLIKMSKAKQVILSTAVVRVKSREGQYITGKALLDNGSQSNFITKKFAERLGLKAINNRIQIKVINQQVSHAMKLVNLNFTSRFDTVEIELQCIVIPEITQNIPICEFDKSSCSIPKNVKLADPQFNVASEIDLLIGAERFWELICVGKPDKIREQPTNIAEVITRMACIRHNRYIYRGKKTNKL